MDKYDFFSAFSSSVILFSLSHITFAETQQVPTVTVDSNSTDSLSSNTIAQVNVITQAQIKASGAKNVEELLLGQPGVQLQDLVGDGSQLTVSIRGFGDNASSNALIMLDGVPLINPDLQAPALNSIAIENIDHIDIIPASEGTLLGDQAVGGVINIVTRNPAKFNVNIEGGAGSYDQNIAQIGVQNIFKNGLSYLASVKEDQNDNYRQHNTDRQTNLFGKLNYQYQTGSLDTTYQFNQQDLLLAGALTAQQVVDNRRQPENLTDFTDSDDRFLHLKNRQFLTTHWQAETDFSVRDTNYSNFFSMPFGQTRAVYELEPKLIGNWENISSRSGIDLMNTNYEIPAITKDTQQRADIYTQLTLPLIKKVNLQIGAREATLQDQLNNGMQQNSSDQVFVKTIGVNWQVNPLLTTYLRRDESFRFPKADENALTPLGDNGLKTQTGVSYEAGATVNNSKWLGKINIYQLDLHNEIVFDPTMMPIIQPYGANTNLDPTRRKGSMLQAGYHLTPRFLLGGQYSYVDARFSSGPDENDHIPFVAQNTYTVYTTYLFNERWSGYLEDVFTGSRFLSGDVTNTQPKLSPFSTVNFNLRFHQEKFIASLRVNNIFNARYNSFAVFEPSEDNSAFYPAAERNFLLTVGYEFV